MNDIYHGVPRTNQDDHKFLKSPVIVIQFKDEGKLLVVILIERRTRNNVFIYYY